MVDSADRETSGSGELVQRRRVTTEPQLVRLTQEETDALDELVTILVAQSGRPGAKADEEREPAIRLVLASGFLHVMQAVRS